MEIRQDAAVKDRVMLPASRARTEVSSACFQARIPHTYGGSGVCGGLDEGLIRLPWIRQVLPKEGLALLGKARHNPADKCG